jgi:hypothetical protein
VRQVRNMKTEAEKDHFNEDPEKESQDEDGEIDFK